MKNMELREMEPRPEFKVHLLNEHGVLKAKHIAWLFTDLLTELLDTCGESGREMAIVRTKLEEASFFAKKAMASRPENQKIETDNS